MGFETPAGRDGLPTGGPSLNGVKCVLLILGRGTVGLTGAEDDGDRDDPATAELSPYLANRRPSSGDCLATCTGGILGWLARCTGGISGSVCVEDIDDREGPATG